MIDESLKFEKHIDYIVNIIKQRIYLLNKIRNHVNTKKALLLYKSNILSYFDIGDLFYNSANKESLQNYKYYRIRLSDVYLLMIKITMPRTYIKSLALCYFKIEGT